ncbi:hypothetical protein DAEQUDRAFT_381320 [Daedalea quercina L-15889]|uniref:Transmembrane protein n=1 Tax=Daedalea quercina L-15889 TaxID=1314783 RepID=A0A165P5U9_9APHY|nr:hypothetical protein DAEQUDRAFT_381320 [Daedalea quercina L-15889]
MSQLPTCVRVPLSTSRRTFHHRKRMHWQVVSVLRVVLRSTIGAALSAGILLLYIFVTHRRAVNIPSSTIHGNHLLGATIDMQASTRPNGRWELLRRPAAAANDLFESDATELLDSYALLDLGDDPASGSGDLHKRDATPVHRPLRFSPDSAEEDDRGREVSTSPTDLASAFRALARAEREDAQRRAGRKSRAQAEV